MPLTDEIIQTYSNRAKELSSFKKWHFFYRASLATNDKKYTEDILINNPTLLNHSLITIKRYDEDYEKFLKQSISAYSRAVPIKPNDFLKKELNLKNPELFTFSKLILNINLLHQFELQVPSFEIINKESVINSLITNQDFIKFSTVKAVNSTLLSKRYNLFDIEDSFINSFKDTFKHKNISTDTILFSNYIYGLTHIVINSSNFYTKPIQKERIAWVLSTFQEYEDEIYNILSLDINIEVAICYRLFGIESNQYIENIKGRIRKQFKDGYIQTEFSNSLSQTEHTNAIALILLNFDNLNIKNR